MNEAERFLEPRKKQSGSSNEPDIKTDETRYFSPTDTSRGGAGENKLPGWFALQGRIGRKTYFWRMLLISIGILVGALLIGLWYGTTIATVLPTGTDFEALGEAAGSQIGLLVSFLSLPFIVTQDTKRLHDLNMSGWNQLFFCIPLIGWLFRLYVLFRCGTNGPNGYGQQPV